MAYIFSYYRECDQSAVLSFFYYSALQNNSVGGQPGAEGENDDSEMGRLQPLLEARALPPQFNAPTTTTLSTSDSAEGLEKCKELIEKLSKSNRKSLITWMINKL